VTTHEQDRPLVIAHRGASGVAPENTLAAFRAALAMGVDGVELDYRHTADGVPVVIHDATLDRTTNAPALWRQRAQAIADCKLAELIALDAGGWFDKARSFADEPLPTLEAALDLICGTGRIAVIERKAGDAGTLVKLLDRKRLANSVVVMAFDWKFLADCHRLEPQLQLVALGEGPLNLAVLQKAKGAHASIIGWNQSHLSGNEIASIHAADMAAWTWTVDDPSRMRQLIAVDIDAITSNFPDRVLQVLHG
jgi:glycerophosphoryl diester phosphodiesterase